MNFLLFFTKRYLLNRKNSRGFSVFSVFAVTGIAVGVTTLILALSVLNGFEELISEKLIGFDAHLRVAGFSGQNLYHYEKTEEKITEITGDRLERVSPFISQIAIAGGRIVKEGLTIKGVKQEYFTGRQTIMNAGGTLNFDADQSGLKKILLGKDLAVKLLVGVGDSITVFALRDNKIPTMEDLPSIERYQVGGIFESGMSKFDETFAYIELHEAQSLFQMEDVISGFEIQLNTLEGVDSLKAELLDALSYPHYVRSIFEMNKAIFTWIDLQKKPIPIVLALIIIVAVFNIISTLLMLVLEKSSSIGTLSALGASGKTITRIFLLQGVYIGVIGIAAGNILAGLIAWLQLEFSIITLPASIYFVSEVPLMIEPWIFLLVSVITLPLTVITAYIPSRIAAKISPVATLRWR